MRKVITIIATICISMIVVVGIPIAINEHYKAGGYLTLWQAEDVLSYYGSVLGAIISVAVLAATIIYNRLQIIKEAKRQAEMKKWQEIEQYATEAMAAIHPYNLAEITSQALDGPEIKLFGNIAMYEVNARKAVDRFKFAVLAEDHPLIATYIDELYGVAEKCIALQKKYIQDFQSAFQDQLGSKMMETNDYDSSMVQIYNWGIFQKGMERGKQLTEKIESVYKEDYCPLITRKTEVFSEIYKRIAEN